MSNKINQTWLNQINSATGNGYITNGNKTFKSTFKAEPYIKNRAITRNERSALAKFRCGVAPLKIETGRYKGIVLEQRTCCNSKTMVEDETYVLLQCPSYNTLRN